jgi:hypothetical protein
METFKSLEELEKLDSLYAVTELSRLLSIDGKNITPEQQQKQLQYGKDIISLCERKKKEDEQRKERARQEFEEQKKKNEEMLNSWQKKVEEFLEVSKKYLLPKKEEFFAPEISSYDELFGDFMKYRRLGYSNLSEKQLSHCIDVLVYFRGKLDSELLACKEIKK